MKLFIVSYPINKAVHGWPVNIHWHMLPDSANSAC